MNNSFVDFLFILLCALVVTLSKSVEVGQVETAPAKVSEGQSAKVDQARSEPLVVQSDGVFFRDAPHPDAQTALADVDMGTTLLLIAGSEDVAHQRVMTVWSDLTRQGRRVQFGVREQAPENTP
ncbi:MAG: hypothetical protein AAGA57_04985 [Planctomycetota bacterium]